MVNQHFQILEQSQQQNLVTWHLVTYVYVRYVRLWYDLFLVPVKYELRVRKSLSYTLLECTYRTTL